MASCNWQVSSYVAAPCEAREAKRGRHLPLAICQLKLEMRLYNTLTKKKEEFIPLEKGKVKMYACGPTVYSYAHLGNMTTYLMVDILRRYLEFSGYEVRLIMNFTDFGHLTDDSDFGEDKMVKASKGEGKTPEEIAKFYEEAFKKDTKALNIKPPAKYAIASKHVAEMIGLVETLIEKGYAYEVNGNVFFETKKFKDYGKLSGNTLEDLKTGARIEPHPDKKDPLDFLLWQKAPKDYPIGWDSPWGKGLPGWHAECSAMCMKYLGDTIDIHTGGEDNIFPHHEDEIAQSESATGKPFVKYWVHKRHMLLSGKRMGKSEGNALTVKGIIDQGYSPIVFRFLTLSSHYRSGMNFSWKLMEEAKEKLERIIEFVDRLKTQNSKPKTQNQLHQQLLQKFQAAMDDDLNTPKALSDIFDFIRETNAKMDKVELKPEEASSILATLNKINEVLGILDYKPMQKVGADEVEELIAKRNEARKNKDFEVADKIRDQLNAMGIEIKDEGEKTVWRQR